MAFLEKKMLVLYRNCSSVSAVPSDDDSSSSLPPQLPPFDYQPKPYLGPSAEQVLEKRKRFLGPSLFYYLSKARKMLYLFDESGMRYLDAFAGIVTVSSGHCHPDIVVYFVNSGTEANEVAMLMARLYSDPCRGIFGSNAALYAKDVQVHIDFGSSGKVAGFIAETIQGVGGSVELAPGYLKHVYDIVRKAGGVCIADEVQTGFGLTGSHYWGFQTKGVIPDIVTMAKGIGNGLPLGTVVTKPEIASAMAQKIQFSNFGGNPVCSAGGACGAQVIGDVRGRGLMVGVELVTDRKERTPGKAETASSVFLLGKVDCIGNVFRIKPPMCFTKDDADFLVDALDNAMSKL
ncbi:hypothetical protein Pint_26760 [Pistacia integerrima]|uniref:Uncharacterized protein n=1 Tax=Pistacia integerrima TaxID=434235 RepID=A0ACC0YVR6_9ROSI|nr:hypothetical protein Pint_26760 [Pistacia integerrima]